MNKRKIVQTAGRRQESNRNETGRLLSCLLPAEVKHWHGAAPAEWFSHLAIEVPGIDCSNEWCEAMSEEEYVRL